MQSGKIQCVLLTVCKQNLYFEQALIALCSVWSSGPSPKRNVPNHYPDDLIIILITIRLKRIMLSTVIWHIFWRWNQCQKPSKIKSLLFQEHNSVSRLSPIEGIRQLLLRCLNFYVKFFLDHNWNCNLLFPFSILNVLTVCRRLSVLIACRTIAFPTKVSKLRMYSRIPVGTMIAAGICGGITSSLEIQSDLNPP